MSEVQRGSVRRLWERAGRLVSVSVEVVESEASVGCVGCRCRCERKELERVWRCCSARE